MRKSRISASARAPRSLPRRVLRGGRSAAGLTCRSRPIRGARAHASTPDGGCHGPTLFFLQTPSITHPTTAHTLQRAQLSLSSRRPHPLGVSSRRRPLLSRLLRLQPLELLHDHPIVLLQQLDLLALAREHLLHRAHPCSRRRLPCGQDRVGWPRRSFTSSAASQGGDRRGAPTQRPRSGRTHARRCEDRP